MAKKNDPKRRLLYVLAKATTAVVPTERSLSGDERKGFVRLPPGTVLKMKDGGEVLIDNFYASEPPDPQAGLPDSQAGLPDSQAGLPAGAKKE